MPHARLAVDIGGTFTDLALEHDGQRSTAKVLTTPAAPEQGVLAGMRQVLAAAGLAPADLALVIHGTTLATNAIIERKGARTALITTQGFRDVLAMGNESRYDQYDLNIVLPEPLVPRYLRLPVPERLDNEGNVLLPLDRDAVRALVPILQREQVESVAVGFLHAFVNPSHERAVRDIIADAMPDLPVSLSCEVSPEMREWERFSTTAANAYVQPLMARYLRRLESELRAMGLSAPLFLMLSGGGLTTIDTACRFPIRLVESGPAGGAIFSAQIARQCGLDRVLSFDMGGTTAKVCLIDDHRPQTARSFEVARVGRFRKGSGLPLRIPVIEMVEIGAGGGSLAQVDALGRIAVGPESAGADPGPACYGHGGTRPAVTDANLLLGRYDPAHFAGGSLSLDSEAARTAIAGAIGEKLRLAPEMAALGVVEMVDENMANAARVHAIESGKGYDGRTLIAFGGGGPVHATRVAEKVGIDRVLVPTGAGVGSAIGFSARAGWLRAGAQPVSAFLQLRSRCGERAARRDAGGGGSDGRRRQLRRADAGNPDRLHALRRPGPRNSGAAAGAAAETGGRPGDPGRFRYRIHAFLRPAGAWLGRGGAEFRGGDRDNSGLAAGSGAGGDWSRRRAVAPSGARHRDWNAVRMGAACAHRPRGRRNRRRSRDHRRGRDLDSGRSGLAGDSRSFRLSRSAAGARVMDTVETDAVDALARIHQQVMWNRLIAVVEEQAQTMIRTAFSTTVREAGDLSAGIFDLQGRMLAQAVTGTPGHVNSMAESVNHFLAKFPAATMRPGDHYITNDPWLGTGHLHDLTVVSPAFHDGAIVGLFANTAHVIDVGGLGLGPEARSVFEEGLYIPIVKCFDQGRPNETLFDFVRAGSRLPVELEGDIYSLCACNDAGIRRLAQMLAEFRLPGLEPLAAFIFENSLRATQAEIAKLKPGTYAADIYSDGYEEEVRLAAAMTISADAIDVDYAGTSGLSARGINVPAAYCRAYACFGIKVVVAPEIPNNWASLLPFRMHIPEGAILNAPRPYPVAVRHVIGQLLPDLMMGCLHQVVPERVTAEGASCLWIPPLRGGPSVSGPARANRPVLPPFELTTFNSGGTGARPGRDGLDATAFPSGVRTTPVEASENTVPVVFWRKEFRPDSGGAGRTRGGCGQIMEIGTKGEMEFAVNAVFDRVAHAPRGRDGGRDGAPGAARLKSGKALRTKGFQIIPQGERLLLLLPGGGGMGDPQERDAALTARDRRDGLVTA